MLTPSYTITPELLLNITQIERFYGQIEELKVPKELELNLTKRNLIQSAFASNKIEGNPLTLPEVTNLILDDRVPANRDEKEVVNYFSLLQQLESLKDRELDVALTTEMHKSLMTGIDKTAGEIRDVMVVVGKYSGEKGNVTLKVKHSPPFHKRKEIEQALTELFVWAQTNKDIPIILLAGMFHHQFVYIHPFEDGNGRVCRLLTALLFIKRGYHINKYFILDDYYDIDRHQYSDALHSADSGDTTAWLTYFAEGVKYSLQSAVSKYKNAIKTLAFEDQPTPRERDALRVIETRHQVTSADIVEELKVTRQQAHALLTGLIAKGLVDKKGITKRSYYFIK